MRCKNCDYALWNLTSRQCPECGDPFKPSDFTFNPNAVRFLCPHCGQNYFGTDDNGHLQPTAFDCVKCEQPITMDEMVLVPADGIHESLTRGKNPDSNPWVRRSEIGTSKAGWRTIGRVLGSPGSLMDTPESLTGRIRHALWFSFLISVVTTLLGSLPFFLLAIIPLGMGGGSGFLSALPYILLFIAVPPIVLIGVWVLNGLVAHGLLKLTGGTMQSVKRSVEAGLYASGANIFMGVPCLGFQLFPLSIVWGGISQAFMLKRLHAVSAIRAFLCTSVFPILAVLAVIGGVVGWSYWMANIFGPQNVTSRVTIQTSSVGMDLVRTAQQNNAWPAHGLDLVVNGSISPYSIDTLEYTAGIPGFEVLPGIDASTVRFYSASQLSSLASNAAAALPPDVIAHRMGDFIFTYHGLPTQRPRQSSDARWIAVWCLHPSRVGISNSSQARRAHDLRVVVTNDWSEIEYDPTTFPAALAAENQARAALGLAPLPDLENFEWIATASQPGSQPMPRITP